MTEEQRTPETHASRTLKRFLLEQFLVGEVEVLRQEGTSMVAASTDQARIMCFRFRWPTGSVRLALLSSSVVALVDMLLLCLSSHNARWICVSSSNVL